MNTKTKRLKRHGKGEGVGRKKKRKNFRKIPARDRANWHSAR